MESILSPLPSHEIICEKKERREKLTPIEIFIHDQEPMDGGEWREQLQQAFAYIIGLVIPAPPRSRNREIT